jgi:hypothetical protein
MPVINLKVPVAFWSVVVCQGIHDHLERFYSLRDPVQLFMKPNVNYLSSVTSSTSPLPGITLH